MHEIKDFRGTSITVGGIFLAYFSGMYKMEMLLWYKYADCYFASITQ